VPYYGLDPATVAAENTNAAGAAGVGTIGAAGAAGAGTAASGLGSALGTAAGTAAGAAAGATDWGKVLAGILGAYGSDQMAKEYRATADKYMAMGAPSRDRYEASFAPGFTMMNDPGYKDALDSVGKESAAAMSMHGNPADSPNAWKQTQLDVYNKVAYPALQGYRQTNASAGGLASFAAATPAADTAATGAQQNIWNAGGSIANNLFSPPQTNSFDLQKFAKSMGWA
jgi:predicted secreted protein